MSTSGSTDFTLTRDQIISNTLQLLGVIGAGQSVTANDTTFCASMLNAMVKGWEAMGIHLWKESEAIVALTNAKNKYTLSSSGGDRAGDNAVETVTTADASSSSLTVSSTTGMTAGDFIGVELDDNTLFWTTIVSVDSSTGLTLTSGLSSTASTGALVLTYTSLLPRPLDITNCRYKYKNGIERRMRRMGRTEFMQLPNKSSSGPPVCYYYSPQLNNGLLYVWPTPSNVGDTLHISVTKTIEDFDNASDNADFPVEWLDCLTYNLATRVAPAYGLTLSKVNPDIIMTAQALLGELMSWDSENGSIKVVPNYRFNR